MKHLLRMMLLMAAVAWLGGCTAYRVLQIEPVGKKGTVISPKFSESYYYVDRDETVQFVMRSSTVDRATGKPVEQVATVRVFWRPVGGKTSMESTSLNATYRYVVMSPDTVGMYEGAGFVRLWGKNGAKKLDGRLMDGDLRLTQSSVNFVDNIGRARIRGNFSARYDDSRAMDMLMGAHREFFARSLESKAATQPAPTETTEEKPAGDSGLLPFVAPPQ